MGKKHDWLIGKVKSPKQEAIMNEIMLLTRKVDWASDEPTAKRVKQLGRHLWRITK